MLEGMYKTPSAGMALEVDISYPISLHDAHNNRPYPPERIIPVGLKIKKLTANFYLKNNYVNYIMSLKQAFELGLKFKKCIQSIIVVV